MEHVTRTLRFSTLQSAMVRGAPYKWKPYTTLNEKFNVQPKIYPGSSVFPVLSYMAIGRGGMGMETGADGEIYPNILQHRSTDAALFNHMPFSLRLLNNDLPANRQSRYAMRQQVEYHGEMYWAYWLKRVDFTQADTEMFLKRIIDGVPDIQSYVYDSSNLTPTPVDMTDSGSNLLGGYNAVASTIIGITLDDFDIQEIRDASRIITRSSNRATISELALCSGATKQIQVPSGSGTIAFNEAIGVEVATFIKAMYPLDFINKSFTDNLELGISEPLFRLEGINA